MPSRSSSTSTSEASEASRQRIILEALGLSDGENEALEPSHPEPDPVPQPEVRDASIASSVSVAEEITSQRSLRHLNAILTEMAVDTDAKQHADPGSARTPDDPGPRAKESFSQVQDLVPASEDVQDSQPEVEQLEDRVGIFSTDEISTEGGSSLAACDATMEDPCLWLADKSLDPLLALLASEVKPLEIGKPQIPRAVLDRAVWELSREHEELLRIADQQASLSRLCAEGEVAKWRRRVKALHRQMAPSKKLEAQEAVSRAAGIAGGDTLQACLNEVAQKNHQMHDIISQRCAKAREATQQDARRAADENANEPVTSRLLMESHRPESEVFSLGQSVQELQGSGDTVGVADIRQRLSVLRSRAHAWGNA